MQVIIPEEFRDKMGHMNIRYLIIGRSFANQTDLTVKRYYMNIYDDAGWKMLEKIGIDDAYFKKGNGLFDMTHHIRFFK